MSRHPRILVCNDDGVYAPGIKHLWKSVHKFAEVTVVAPALEQSATSLSITIRQPLYVEKTSWPSYPQANVWCVNGTPADCVKLALRVVLPEPPDLIISGINRGSNAGRNVLYSGTVAAVMEGVMHEIPGIAFSALDYTNPAYHEYEELAAHLIQYIIRNPLPTGTLFNVNFPSKNLGKIKGVRLTQQGKEYWAENPEKRSHPFQGAPYYWLGGKLATFSEKEDCDIEWLKKGYATAVPLKINDLTNQDFFTKEKEKIDLYMNNLQLFDELNKP